MTLRSRLVISFTALLLVVISVVGTIATRSINDILVGQIDRQLGGFAQRSPGPQPGMPPLGPDDDFIRPVAELLIDADDNVVGSRPSGFADDPDPLPDASTLPDTDQPFDLESVDGTIRYRAIVGDLGGEMAGARIVWAAPLTEVEDATARLVGVMVVAGAVILLLGGTITWLSVRRAMRPVDQMVETAEAIASGDLSRRVPELDPSTELGRLGRSLNEMLVHIEDSVETEREAQQRLRQFVADASHELRTPITAISGYAELYRKGGLATGEDEERAWSRIESEGKRMGSLVETLLALARLGTAEPLHISEVDLVRLAQDAASDHRVIDPERPVTVSAPETLVVEADSERIHQVVTNLLSNVRVHTPPWTKIEIGVFETGEGAVIEVTDDGTGFPASSLDQVFDRFYRADPSRSRRSGGSGLGLAIVKAIVEAHHGTVHASNTAEGGARVSITLPKRQNTSPDTRP